MKINKTAVNNIFQMGTVQLLNYIFPVIMIPYLIRTIGVSNYGKTATALAVVQFLVIISDYGFNFTATQKISLKNRIDNKLFSLIYSFKLILAAFVLIAVIIFVYFWNDSGISLVFIFGFYVYFVAQTLIPEWLFRGLNKMVYISLFTFFSKAVTLLLLFIFVNEKTDYYLLGIVYGIPSTLMMLISIIISKKFNARFVKVTWKDILIELNEGKDMFLSNIIGTIYTTLNPIILSIVAGPYATGLYSTCEKIIGVINSMTNAVSQAVYPIVCKVLNEKKYLFYKKFSIPTSFLYFGWWPPIVLIFGFILFFNAELLLELVNGSGVIREQIILLRVMAFIPFAISFGHLFGIQTLLPLNRQKWVRNSIFKGAVTNIIFGLVGAYYLGAIGMGLTVLLCEIIVGISEFNYINKDSKESELKEKMI